MRKKIRVGGCEVGGYTPVNGKKCEPGGLQGIEWNRVGEGLLSPESLSPEANNEVMAESKEGEKRMRPVKEHFHKIKKQTIRGVHIR